MPNKEKIEFSINREKYAIPYLFGKIEEKLGFKVVRMRDLFPDAVLKKENKFYKTEFEYKSSNFRQHNHPVGECDLIICWEHDWLDCPIAKVIPLSKFFEQLPNTEEQEIIEDILKEIRFEKRKEGNITVTKIQEKISDIQDKYKKLVKNADEKRKVLRDKVTKILEKGEKVEKDLKQEKAKQKLEKPIKVKESKNKDNNIEYKTTQTISLSEIRKESLKDYNPDFYKTCKYLQDKICTLANGNNCSIFLPRETTCCFLCPDKKCAGTQIEMLSCHHYPVSFLVSSIF